MYYLIDGRGKSIQQFSTKDEARKAESDLYMQRVVTVIEIPERPFKIGHPLLESN